jgi:hypothetical protein
VPDCPGNKRRLMRNMHRKIYEQLLEKYKLLKNGKTRNGSTCIWLDLDVDGWIQKEQKDLTL